METEKMYEDWLKERDAYYKVCSIDDLINSAIKQEDGSKNIIIEGEIGKKCHPVGENGYIFFTIDDVKTGKSVAVKTSLSQSNNYHIEALSEIGDLVSVAGSYYPRQNVFYCQYMFNKSLMKDMLNESGDKGDKNGD